MLSFTYRTGPGRHPADRCGALHCGTCLNRVEVLESDLQMHRAAFQPVSPQPAPHLFTQFQQPSQHEFRVLQVRGKRRLMRNRLRLLLRHHRTFVDSSRKLPQVLTAAAKVAPQLPADLCRSCPIRRTPIFSRTRPVTLPTPQRRLTGSGSRNSCTRSASTTTNPSGLSRSRLSPSSGSVVPAGDTTDCMEFCGTVITRSRLWLRRQRDRA